MGTASKIKNSALKPYQISHAPLVFQLDLQRDDPVILAAYNSLGGEENILNEDTPHKCHMFQRPLPPAPV